MFLDPEETNLQRSSYQFTYAGTRDLARKRSRLSLPRSHWNTLTMHLLRWTMHLLMLTLKLLHWSCDNIKSQEIVGCLNLIKVDFIAKAPFFPGLHPWSRVATVAWFHIRRVPRHHNAVITFKLCSQGMSVWSSIPYKSSFDLCHWFRETIGASVEGRQLAGIVIGQGVRQGRPLLRPQVIFIPNIALSLRLGLDICLGSWSRFGEWANGQICFPLT